MRFHYRNVFSSCGILYRSFEIFTTMEGATIAHKFDRSAGSWVGVETVVMVGSSTNCVVVDFTRPANQKFTLFGVLQ